MPLDPKDPSFNVGNLVEAEARFQNAMREAETRRINELGRQRDWYESRIATMLKEQLQTTSNLLSTQLTNIQTTYDRRVAELERFRHESAGKSSNMAIIFSVISAVGTAVVVYVAVKGGN